MFFLYIFHPSFVPVSLYILIGENENFSSLLFCLCTLGVSHSRTLQLIDFFNFSQFSTVKSAVAFDFRIRLVFITLMLTEIVKLIWKNT
jgi:hypothetical protein